MLHVGQILCRPCQPVGRRELLRAGSSAFLGLGLADLLRAKARGAESKPRANSVILLWLWGGPSHVDLFDMKPDAPTDYRGPYRPIATNVPGLEISELLPHLTV